MTQARFIAFHEHPERAPQSGPAPRFTRMIARTAAGVLLVHSRVRQVWELPVFLPIGGGKHILLVNPAWKQGSDYNVKYVWYWIGVWNPATRTFTPDTTQPRLFDYGEHFTGPSGFVDPSSACISQ